MFAHGSTHLPNRILNSFIVARAGGKPAKEREKKGMSKYSFAAIGLLAFVFTSHAAGAILLQDDFESYADETAFDAAWTPVAGNVSLSTAQAFGGSTKSANIPTVAARSTRTFTSGANTAPTATDNLEFSFRFYDDFTAQGRIQVELVDGVGSSTGQAIGMGTGNTPTSSEYFWRIVGVDPDGAG